mmetsp:Transcript_100299/g.284128  ORF Transcript_100299/g.284128 Transcript_100299/m.284128 type:complete len:367 (+) Transcript_100299:130-1230(+)
MDAWEEEVVLHGDPADDQVGELRIRIRELPMADGVHASTGCQLWSASVALALEIFRRPHLVKGKHVIEVGAGCGLLGIATARLARRTLITDGDEEVVMNLAHNLRLNEASWKAGHGEAPREASARQLRWEEVLGAPWPPGERAEVILASDIIYGHWGDTVAQAVLNLLAPGGLVMLAASEDRRSGVRAFKDCMRDANFKVVETILRVPLGNFRTYECRERAPEDTESPYLTMREREEPGPAAAGAAPPEVVPGAAKAKAAPAAGTAKPGTKERAPPGAAHAPGGSGEARELWRVVGGLVRGGIIVRSGSTHDVADYVGRLAHGSLVEAIEQTAARLHYSKLDGEGPERGWVSFFSANGTRLLAKAC